MDIIGAAALIAVGLVIAALVYGRTHRAGPAGRSSDASNREGTNRELAERTAAIARREDALAQRDAALADRDALIEQEQHPLGGQRQEPGRLLEQAPGISASRA